jgi:biotin transport system substrate-specific component
MHDATHTLNAAVTIPGSRIADAIRILLASLAIGVLARIAVFVGPVPVTGQTLGVLAVGLALGPRRGTMAVVLYLAQGLAGVPVFAGGAAGFAVLAGPTAGYLLGFVPAAWIAGTLSRRIDARRVVPVVLVLTAATAAIYLGGVTVLSRLVGWGRVWAVGIAPFLVGDAIKIGILASGAPFLARRVSGRTSVRAPRLPDRR